MHSCLILNIGETDRESHMRPLCICSMCYVTTALDHEKAMRRHLGFVKIQVTAKIFMHPQTAYDVALEVLFRQCYLELNH